jgi:branched-chain amino acid transport system ATP-binding protein
VTPLLDVVGVSVAFGGLQALDAASIRVPEGAIVGLIGPNGAGKTTLFNVISGLQPMNAGAIVFGGDDIASLRPRDRAARGIGRSFQNLGIILDETVGVNIMAAQHLAARYRGWDLGLRPWRWMTEERRLGDRAMQAASTFGLAELWDDYVCDLSFGMARFVELACVLVQQPRLMLLDEPTTGLDLLEVARLLQVLQDVRADGTTILLVAHDVRFVMDLCDHVYVLGEGRLLCSGPPSVVQRDAAVIKAYLGRSA